MDRPPDVLGKIDQIQLIAVGRQIRELERLKRIFGPGRWRKLKGLATVRLPDGKLHRAEVHLYEAHGIGRVELKVKRLIGPTK